MSLAMISQFVRLLAVQTIWMEVEEENVAAQFIDMLQVRMPYVRHLSSLRVFGLFLHSNLTHFWIFRSWKESSFVGSIPSLYHLNSFSWPRGDLVVVALSHCFWEHCLNQSHIATVIELPFKQLLLELNFDRVQHLNSIFNF